MVRAFISVRGQILPFPIGQATAVNMVLHTNVL